jgi:hypothetical protein
MKRSFWKADFQGTVAALLSLSDCERHGGTTIYIVSMQLKALRRTVLFLLLFVTFCIGCRQERPPLGQGAEWLTMTRHEKQLFVSAYLDGISSGTFDLCNGLENSALIIKIKDSIASGEGPCTHFRPRYTHTDTKAIATYEYSDPYVNIIDGFYKHPECRVMPYTAILQHLNDAELFKSSDDLYMFVRSGDAHWGAFSGFEGIEKCYGADRKR